MKHKSVDAWYKQASGHVIAEFEHALLEPILNKLFGYYILQCGALTQSKWLSYSPAIHKILLSPMDGQAKPHIYADFAAMPFKANSVDVVVLPHVLECVKKPHIVLHEIERILIPEGHVVIISFNPLSLWGIWRILNRNKCSFPAKAHWLSYFKLSRMLHDLGYEIIEKQGCLFNSPWRRTSSSRFWERLGRRCWPGLGGLTLLVAKKKIATLTPIKPQWRVPEMATRKKIVETSVRTFKRLRTR